MRYVDNMPALPGDVARVSSDPTLPWPIRIENARDRGEFSEDDKILCSDWVTCACGQQDARIPRDKVGQPLDRILVKLGMRFTQAVDINYFTMAESVLARIEDRAIEVIRRNAK